MNTWYTTNKAAIDKQALNSKLQVGAWAMYIDMQRNVADSSMTAPPAAGKAGGDAALTVLEATSICAISTSTSIG